MNWNAGQEKSQEKKDITQLHRLKILIMVRRALLIGLE